jgi:hypothetical protein
VLTKRPRRLAALPAGPAFAREVGRHAALIAGQLPSAVPGTADGLDDWTPFAGAYLMPPWPLPNVWVGTSIENDDYTWRADDLRRTPAAVRFLSLEPLLGPLPSLSLDGLGWVIAGGESGPGCRPPAPAWVRGIRDQCTDGDMPLFFKLLCTTRFGDWSVSSSRGRHFSVSGHPDGLVCGHPDGLLPSKHVDLLGLHPDLGTFRQTGSIDDFDRLRISSCVCGGHQACSW